VSVTGLLIGHAEWLLRPICGPSFWEFGMQLRERNLPRSTMLQGFRRLVFDFNYRFHEFPANFVTLVFDFVFSANKITSLQTRMDS